MDNKKLKGKLSCVVCYNCKARRQYDKSLIALLLVNKQVWILCSPTIENVKIVELRRGNNLQCKYIQSISRCLQNINYSYFFAKFMVHY